MPRQTRQIEVTESPEEPDITTIPEPMHQHFMALGQVLSWGSRDEMAITKASLRGRFPINLNSDIPEEVKRKSLTDALRKFGARLNPDGTIGRGDCLLFAQPVTAREKHAERERADWMRHYDPNEEAYAAKLNDQIRAGKADKIGRVFVRDVGLPRY